MDRDFTGAISSQAVKGARATTRPSIGKELRYGLSISYPFFAFPSKKWHCSFCLLLSTSFSCKVIQVSLKAPIFLQQGGLTGRGPRVFILALHKSLIKPLNYVWYCFILYLQCGTRKKTPKNNSVSFRWARVESVHFERGRGRYST